MPHSHSKCTLISMMKWNEKFNRKLYKSRMNAHKADFQWFFILSSYLWKRRETFMLSFFQVLFLVYPINGNRINARGFYNAAQNSWTWIKFQFYSQFNVCMYICTYVLSKANLPIPIVWDDFPHSPLMHASIAILNLFHFLVLIIPNKPEQNFYRSGYTFQTF